MAGFRITKRAVEALACPRGKDKDFRWDDSLTGFGVCVYASGRKSFVIKYPIKGQPHRSRRMTIGEYGVLTPDEARDEAKIRLGNAARGIDPVEAAQDAQREALFQRPFRELAEDFMSRHVETDLKPGTAGDYRSLLKRHILPALGKKPIASITRDDIRLLHKGLKNAHLHRANRAVAVISAIWKWGQGEGLAPAGECPAKHDRKNFKRPVEIARKRYLSTAELERLSKALRKAETTGLPWDVRKASKHHPKGAMLRKLDPYAIAAIRLLALTGARLREILTAKWEYLDADNGQLLLPDSKSGQKEIHLGPTGMAIIKKLPRDGDNPYLIPGLGQRKKKGGKDSEKFTPRHDLKKPWAAICKEAKLPGLRIHDLRHSYAAKAASSNLGLPIIGALLGHRNQATTQRYAHLANDPLRRAATMIDEQIGATLGGK